MSGYQDYGVRRGDSEEGGLFVQKPFSRDNLLDVIAQALKASPATIQTEVTVPMKARRRARRNRRAVAV